MFISECNICGSDATRKAKVEGTILDVCDKCVRFGEEVKEVEYRKVVKVPHMEDIDRVLVKDFSKTIRKSREKRKLTQEELANKLNEKVSLIKRVEEGWHPSNKLLAKIEKFLDIKLMEEALEPVTKKKQNEKKLTIGDVVDIS